MILVYLFSVFEEVRAGCGARGVGSCFVLSFNAVALLSLYIRLVCEKQHGVVVDAINSFTS